MSAATELLARRKARRSFSEYISYVFPRYKHSAFSRAVCETLDGFVADVFAGLRPILVLQAPPQHGKSELVSRRLPAYLLGKFPDLRVASASYSDDLAHTFAQDVRRNVNAQEHKNLFAYDDVPRKFAISRIGEFSSPGGSGSYFAVGVGAGLTGRPVDIGIIDDVVRDAKQALSQTVKESHWDWYQSVFVTRLSECSGQVIMGTSWAEDDLPSRIMQVYRGDSRLRVLKFPAINSPDEVGYNADLPDGALVPALHSVQKLRETKSLLSAYWWAAMYQQCPMPAGGNVFDMGKAQFYKSLPQNLTSWTVSVDCTFKNTDGSDYVVAQVWAKSGVNCYLVNQVRGRFSFTETVSRLAQLRNDYPQCRTWLIEDKANGTAVIDVLRSHIPGIIPVTPTESKLARAHAVTSYWEAGNVHIPDPLVFPWSSELVSELAGFPAAAHDDQVDSMTQALHHLHPARKGLKINPALLAGLVG